MGKRNVVMLALSLVFALALAQPRPIVAATETVQALSTVFRTVESERGRLVFTIQTVYQISGREVLPRSFWRQIKPGARIQLKLERQYQAWVVRRVNLLEAK
jgi:hypothetical protein